MWVVYNPNTLSVYKCVITKGEAQRLQKKITTQWITPAIEQFETGRFDQWLTFKRLQHKGLYF